MRFHAEHRFAGPADAVVAVLTNPHFHQQLQLPDLSLPEVVVSEAGGDEAVLRLRYEYVGQLDPIARRLLGDRRLTWLQELRLDRRTRAGHLTFRAEAAPERLNGSADFTVESTASEPPAASSRPGGPATSAGSSRSGGSTESETESEPIVASGPGGASSSVRRLDGELRVAVRPIGGMAERRILPGLLRRLDIEAQAVDDWLQPG